MTAEQGRDEDPNDQGSLHNRETQNYRAGSLVTLVVFASSLPSDASKSKLT